MQLSTLSSLCSSKLFKINFSTRLGSTERLFVSLLFFKVLEALERCLQEVIMAFSVLGDHVIVRYSLAASQRLQL